MLDSVSPCSALLVFDWDNGFAITGIRNRNFLSTLSWANDRVSDS